MNKSKFIHILFAGIFKFCIIFLFLLGALNLRAQSINDFVTRWDLSKTGSAVSGGLTSITFNTTNTGGSISYTWQEISPGTASGSGTFNSSSGTSRTISGLPQNATIELRIAPTNLQRFYINFGTNRDRLTDVTQWGNTSWTTMNSMFLGCSNLQITATDLPNLNGVLDMSGMFNACLNLNGPSNINNWNTSNVTNMSGLFSSAFSFNQNIGSWNTGNVATMRDMFSSASSFNHNLGNWILNSAVSLEMMFDNCGMSCDNYSKTLTGWSLSSTATGRTLGAWGITYGTNDGPFQTAALQLVHAALMFITPRAVAIWMFWPPGEPTQMEPEPALLILLQPIRFLSFATGARFL
jgi:surface protein